MNWVSNTTSYSPLNKPTSFFVATFVGHPIYNRLQQNQTRSFIYAYKNFCDKCNINRICHLYGLDAVGWWCFAEAQKNGELLHIAFKENQWNECWKKNYIHFTEYEHQEIHMEHVTGIRPTRQTTDDNDDILSSTFPKTAQLSFTQHTAISIHDIDMNIRIQKDKSSDWWSAVATRGNGRGIFFSTSPLKCVFCSSIDMTWATGTHMHIVSH